MSTRVRIATFNLKQFDDSNNFNTRLAVLRPQLERLRADILCFQEVAAQCPPGQSSPRQLTALRTLIAGTEYESFCFAYSKDAHGALYADRNLVTLSRFNIASYSSLRDVIGVPEYRKCTAVPQPPAAEPQTGDRAPLYAKIDLPGGGCLHVLNVHLKSRLPSGIEGQTLPNSPKWRSATGWAEGFFVSSLKRMGQALQSRAFIDTLFDSDPDARVVVCGDFNSDIEEVPLQAIRGSVEDTLNSDLRSRVIFACERTVPEGSRFTLFHRGKPCMLDHILVSQPMLRFYCGTEIHNEALEDQSIHFPIYLERPASDHAPVVAGFELS